MIFGNPALTDDVATTVDEIELSELFIVVLQIYRVVTMRIPFRPPRRSRYFREKRIPAIRLHRNGNSPFLCDPSGHRGLAARLACCEHQQPNKQSDVSHDCSTIGC